MLKHLFVIMLFLIAITPAFAGSLLVVGSNPAPSYSDTGSPVNMLNLSLLANVSGSLTITKINISINNMRVSNLSGILVYNTTAGGAPALLGYNTTFNETDNFTTIAFSSALNITDANTTSLIIYANISSTATSRERFNISISSVNDIQVSENNNVHNITTGNSSLTQIQDVQANGVITPNYLDTGVQNQSFLLFLRITGDDTFENISIKVPSEYPIANITGIKNSTTIFYGNDTVGFSPFFNLTFGGNTINISNITIRGGRGFDINDAELKINFTANTSSNPVGSLHVNTTVKGSNLTSVNVTDYSSGSMNVTTQSLISITSVTLAKRTAILNGTDFWEINLTVNITANISGILQFRMNNWNSSTVGFGRLNITNANGTVTNESTNYAMLRNTSSTGSTNSGQLNISTEYGSSARGLALRYTGETRILTLKMILPSNTPMANDYRTTYFMLFRSET